ncbi:MAG: acetate--CoA ligase [Nitrososphaeria archaeon]
MMNDKSLESGEEVFNPSSDIVENAFLKDYESVYRESIADPEGFWNKAARELEWFSPWSKVLDWQYPRARWFVDARCNIVHNSVDRHVGTWRRNKVAIYWEGEPGEKRVITYGELYRQVNKLANALKKLGVRKGDFVTIYLPIVPEQVISMLACAKVGAVHNVIYYGYSGRILRERIMETRSKVLITSNAAYFGGKLTVVASTIAQLSRCPSLKYVLIKKRVDIPIIMEQYRSTHVKDEPRYLDWDDLLNGAPHVCECETMDSEDPLFIIYTSGTAGKPKGIIHSHGGYMVGSYLTTKLVFDLRDTDVYWCTASPGWITGHTYVVYGPLINGASIFIYEGDLGYPSPGRWAKIIDDYGISVFYTIPTYIREFMIEEDAIRQYSLHSLRILGTVGEPIDPSTWKWFYRFVGKSRCPVIDTWWQTETGVILITGFPSIPLKPGSVGKPFPTIKVSVITPTGQILESGQEGLLAVNCPWPGLMETVYQDPRKYIDYWDIVEGWYITGDVASVDKDGYFWIKGRSDDVIKIAGYRIGTAEIEKAILSHPAVVDAAAIGKPSTSGGEIVKVFIVLRDGWSLDDELTEEIKRRVMEYIGPIAVPSEVEAITSLPRTRSGKILRRFLRDKELGRQVFEYDS